MRRALAFFRLALLRDLQQSRWEHACDVFTLALYQNLIENLSRPMVVTSYTSDAPKQ